MRATKKLRYKGRRGDEYLPYHNFRAPPPGFNVFPWLHADWQQVLGSRT